MSTEKQVKDLAKKLRNVGPKLAAKLVEAGIDTPEKLRQTGAKKAFEKLYPTGDSYGDFNAAYLYALEGAIRNCDWLDIPEEMKQEFRQYAQNLQSRKRIDCENQVDDGAERRRSRRDEASG
jgi:DNA transformation protein